MKNDVFGKLYSMYYREIYIYLYSFCKNPAYAEDLTQETFLKAILSFRGADEEIRPWLYTVARNLYFNLAKKEKHKRRWEEIIDLSCDIPDEIIKSETNRALYKALEKLEKTKREALTLFYFGALSQKEISRIMNLSPENVRVLIYRSKREIRKLMEDEGYDIP